ncbi:MAG: DUF3316 domain-containing protein [Candidatus Symbiothrix sp.]|jgi:hypothetical protein|nr:DUF3316 domain-containing protein [Candidatus Symbiothrix sp.]
MSERYKWVFFSAFMFLSVAAQEQYQSTIVGVGAASTYDTYLSPLEYKGSNFGLMHEQMHMTGLLDGNMAMQQLFNLNVALGDNRSQTSSTYMAMLEYDFGLYRRFKPVNGFQLFAGLQADGQVGGVYNLRNGNNPATLKTHLDLGISGIAAYQFQIKKQPVKLRYQLNVPAVGVLYAPEFGQSYYEIYDLGDNDGIVHFSSFHNYLAMRNILTVELPFKSRTIRFSYINWMYETKINDVNTRIHSNTFFIGFSKYFTVRPGRTVKQFMPSNE